MNYDSSTKVARFLKIKIATNAAMMIKIEIAQAKIVLACLLQPTTPMFYH